MFDNPFIHCPADIQDGEFMEFTDIIRAFHTLIFQKVHPSATIPSWMGLENGGLDIHSCEFTLVEKGKIKKVRTGLLSEFPNDLVCLLRDRSGLASKGLHVLAGVIDAGYRGEWTIVLCNLGEEDYLVKMGERVAQAIFVQRNQPRISEAVELSESERGTGGFGSTGIF